MGKEKEARGKDAAQYPVRVRRPATGPGRVGARDDDDGGGGGGG